MTANLTSSSSRCVVVFATWRFEPDLLGRSIHALGGADGRHAHGPSQLENPDVRLRVRRRLAGIMGVIYAAEVRSLTRAPSGGTS
jgi:hypothetical protein